jgi:mannitol/fructose-specific phosphotransferase system IIA component (Ntr-type)
MKIYQLLSKQTVKAQLAVSTKEQTLDAVINLLGPLVDSSKLETIRLAVKERESIMSTGVGKGLAIPHAKVPGLDSNFAAFALLENGIEYSSIDNAPVQLVFLIVGPATHNSEHIKMLSRISRLMNNDDFREKLYECSDEEAIIEAFKLEEERYFN